MYSEKLNELHTLDYFRPCLIMFRSRFASVDVVIKIPEEPSFLILDNIPRWSLIYSALLIPKRPCMMLTVYQLRSNAICGGSEPSTDKPDIQSQKHTDSNLVQSDFLCKRNRSIPCIMQTSTLIFV